MTEEAGLTEVNTSTCDSISLAQPAPFALASGSTLKWSFTHTTLTPASGTALVRFSLGDEEVFRVEIPLPAKDAAYSGTHQMTRATKMNDTMVWHVENHGQNNWKLVQMESP